MRIKKPLKPRSQKEFEELLEPHLAALYRTAFRFTGHSQDAEDLLQSVLLKLCGHLDTLRELDAIRPWVTRVMYRQFVDDTRWRKRQPVNLRLSGDGTFPDTPDIEALADPGDDPETQAAHTQFMEQLSTALSGLQPEQRALIALHDMEGHTMDEIASALDIPLGTVKSRLHRARARLRVLMSLEPSRPTQRVTTQEAGNL